MPGDPTPKHGFPTMAGGSDLGQSIDDTYNELVDALDDTIATWASGTLASLPTSTVGSPGIAGRHYLATDTGVLYLDTGTGWIALNEPIGHLTWWAGAGDPPGGTHLEADGRAISRTTYPLYMSVIGTLHGAGNGTTTVNIPDVSERVLVGRGGTKSRVTVGAIALSQSGGEERHTLTVDEMPSHAHGTDGHPLGFLGPVGGSPDGQFSLGSGYGFAVDAGTAAAGGGLAHNNLPPYLVLTPIIRVA